ncbi:MAG: Ca2+-transporting ATPase [Shewanella psychromarinicola]|jgi:Ca2+-transporting ATPase|uniref:cation-transporting P-type ATPase n=1 Tax=Shewanella psychromarinicola TaxID=2487742 RepID=UPI003EEBABC0
MELKSTWHDQSTDSVASSLATNVKEGLSLDEIIKRREQFGQNKITEHKGTGPLKRFLLQFNQPLVYILLAACVVTLLLHEWVDSAVIFAVVLVNAIIGFVQESKALNAINSLSNSVKTKTTVLRAGKRQEILAEELVPGDVVVLQAGDKTPADLRLIKIRDLKIDESSLTGESLPTEKDVSTLSEKCLLGDRRNMAFSSTLVTYGTGIGVVVHIGDNTEIGKISEMIATTETLDTPLTKRIASFSHVLLYAILGLATLTVFIGWLHGRPLIDTFMAAVALAVGAIPEGLPAAVTIMLAIGVSRMAKKHAVIRNLPAVETLGSTTVICSDKTGTLTKNQMTVTDIWAGGRSFSVSGSGYDPHGEFNDGGKLATLPTISAGFTTLKAGFLCNDALLNAPDLTLEKPHQQWTITGDPTEAALIVSAAKVGINESQLTQNRLDIIPFQSEYQYMAILNAEEEGNVVYMKGSIESILPKCICMLDHNGEQVELANDLIHQQVQVMASRGLRVLAFARKRADSNTSSISHEFLAQNLEFLGLQAMIDPPRPEAIEAVKACHLAGIDVKMITGDHALTATSIAHQLTIVDNASGNATITGQELAILTHDQLMKAALTFKVFARVTPENKLQLVKALQAQDQVVAMTGDGVNDAPALRRADIGVAMALNGTEVARDAADMMLTDDNFATVRDAVEEGRGVFDNLKKFIVWTLPTNGGEGLVILVAVILGVSLPLLPLHILWINMTTAIFLGLMLAFEPKEKGIMLRPPNIPNAPIIDSILLWRIVLVSSLLCITAFGLYELELSLGASEEQAQTVAVAMFVVGEAFYLLNCRSLERSIFSVGLFSNPWVWFGIIIMALLQGLFTYLPIMNAWFNSAPIDFYSWIRVFACGALISVIVSAEKRWRFNKKHQVTTAVKC